MLSHSGFLSLSNTLDAAFFLLLLSKNPKKVATFVRKFRHLLAGYQMG